MPPSDPYRVRQVLKNRFSGDLGPMPLHFNKDSLSFVVKRRKKASESEQTRSEPVPERDAPVRRKVQPAAAASQARKTETASESPSEALPSEAGGENCAPESAGSEGERPGREPDR